MFDAIRRLDDDEPLPEFDCGDTDLNEFFRDDAKPHANQLLAVTYLVLNEGLVVGYFSVSNDAIRLEDVPKSAFKRLLRKIPRSKHYKSIPTVKVGRFAICNTTQRSNTGSDLMSFKNIGSG